MIHVVESVVISMVQCCHCLSVHWLNTVQQSLVCTVTF